jgi:hypothetical protein
MKWAGYCRHEKEAKILEDYSWIISGNETLRKTKYRLEDTKMHLKKIRLEGVDCTVYLPLCMDKWRVFVKKGMKCRGTKFLY